MKRIVIILLLLMLPAWSLAHNRGNVRHNKDYKEYYLRDHFIYGDSVDATAKLQALMSGKTNAIFICDTSAVYYFTYTDDSLFIPTGCILDMRGSKFHFEINGSSKALSLGNYAQIWGGGGELDVDTLHHETDLASAGSYGDGVAVGDYSTGVGFHDWVIRDLVISSEALDGSGIFITDDSYNGLIENIRVPANTTMFAGLEIHWGGPDLIDTSDATGGAQGAMVTGHPHDIDVINFWVDSLARASSRGITLKAAWNIRVRGGAIRRCAVGVDVGNGDYGFAYIDTTLYSNTREGVYGQGIMVADVALWKCVTGFTVGGDIDHDTYLKDVIDTINVRLPVRFDNCFTYGDSTGDGWVINMSDGVVIDHCGATEHNHGVFIGPNARSTTVSNGDWYENVADGINIDDAANPPDNIKIFNNRAWGNANYGIQVDEAKVVYIEGNELGDTTETNQGNGIFVDDAAGGTARAYIKWNKGKASNALVRVDSWTNLAEWQGNVEDGSGWLLRGPSGVQADADTIDANVVHYDDISDLTGSTNADSIRGLAVQTVPGNLQDNFILKVFVSGADTILQWEADAGAGGALTYFTEADAGVISVLSPTAPNTHVQIDSMYLFTASDTLWFRLGTDSAFMTSAGLNLGNDLTNGLGNLVGWGNLIGSVSSSITFGGTITNGSAILNEAEMEILDGGTITTVELNYLSGVTSAIQTQLDATLKHDGSQALTGDWAAGDFDITGLERVEADTVETSVITGPAASASIVTLDSALHMLSNLVGTGIYWAPGEELDSTFFDSMYNARGRFAPGALSWPDVFANLSRTYFDTTVDAEGDSVKVILSDYKDSKTVNETLDATINPAVTGEIAVTDEGGINISWTSGTIYDSAGNFVTTTSAGATACTDNAINHLYWSTGTSLTLSTSPPDLGDVCVATIQCQDGDIWGRHTDFRASLFTRAVQNGIGQLFQVAVADGLLVSRDGDGTGLQVELSAGTYFLDAHDEHVMTLIESRTTDMHQWFRSSGSWTHLDADAITTTYYDNGTDTTAISNNWFVRALFLAAEYNSSDAIHYIYAQEQFALESSALAAANPVIPPGLGDFPIVTAVVFQQGETDLTNATFIDVRPDFGVISSGSVVNAHGDLTELDQDQHEHYLKETDTGAFALTILNVPTITGDLATNGTIDTVDVATLGSTVPKITDDTVNYQTAYTHSQDNSQAHSDYMLNTGDIVTGVYDFGGATSVEIPNGTNPTTDAAGEVTVDTDDGLELYTDASRLIGYRQTFTKTLALPDSLQAHQDAWPIFVADSNWVPHGITLIALGIKTDNSSTYSVSFEAYDDPADGSPTVLDVVATSTSREATETTLTSSAVAGGQIIYANLPTTAGTTSLTLFGVYYVNPGD
jgi:hypothetical protein